MWEAFQFDDKRFGPLEATVGFVAKSAFWLGVVYSAIAFDLGKPNAFAPITAAMPYAASYPLGTFASEAATAWRQSTDDRRPEAIPAILRARNCSRPAPARLRSDDSLILKDRRSHACFPERSG